MRFHCTLSHNDDEIKGSQIDLKSFSIYIEVQEDHLTLHRLYHVSLLQPSHLPIVLRALNHFIYQQCFHLKN